MAQITKRVQVIRRVQRTVETTVEIIEEEVPVEVRTPEGYDEPMELCLCGKCASAYYHLPDHIIRRVDPYQYYKDTCDYCGVRSGYDYLRYEKKKEARHDIG